MLYSNQENPITGLIDVTANRLMLEKGANPLYDCNLEFNSENTPASLSVHDFFFILLNHNRFVQIAIRSLFNMCVVVVLIILMLFKKLIQVVTFPIVIRLK